MMKRSSLVAQLRDFSMGPLIGMIFNMLTVPLITRLVSPDEFGKSSLFALVENVFLMIVLLGLDQSFVRFYNEKKKEPNLLLFNSLVIPILFCIIIICVIFIFHRTISISLFGSYEPMLLILLCLYLPSSVLNRFGMLILRMELRGKAYSFVNIISKISYFTLLLLFLLFYERTFRAIVVAVVCNSFVNTLLTVFLTRLSWRVTNFSADKILLKALLAFSLPLVPASLLSWLFNSFDKVALRALSTFQELGLYSASFKIVSIISIIGSIFNTAWGPVAYDWYEKKTDHEEYDKVGTSVLVFISTLFAIIVLFRGVILFLLGPEYRNTESVFVFLLFVPIVHTISETTALGIVFAKKTIYILFISLISSIVNIVGNYLLIPNYGAQGAAFATFGSYIIFFWLRTLISRNLWYKFDLIKYVLVIVIMVAYPICVYYELPKYYEIILFLILVSINTILVVKLIKGKK